MRLRTDRIFRLNYQVYCRIGARRAGSGFFVFVYIRLFLPMAPFLFFPGQSFPDTGNRFGGLLRACTACPGLVRHHLLPGSGKQIGVVDEHPLMLVDPAHWLCFLPDPLCHTQILGLWVSVFGVIHLILQILPNPYHPGCQSGCHTQVSLVGTHTPLEPASVTNIWMPYVRKENQLGIAIGSGEPVGQMYAHAMLPSINRWTNFPGFLFPANYQLFIHRLCHTDDAFDFVNDLVAHRQALGILFTDDVGNELVVAAKIIYFFPLVKQPLSRITQLFLIKTL